MDVGHLPQAMLDGTRIVHACGLGSIPADLSVYLTRERLARDGLEAKEIKFLMGPVYRSVIAVIGGGCVIMR
jgi:short subunit dehydrogenase-like uncharacterized protein